MLQRRTFLLSVLAPACVSAADGSAPMVKVQRRGDAVVIDVERDVPASLADTWAVLTDFEHMAAFMHNITSSQVVARHGDSLELAQTARAGFAFVHLEFASLRAVELTPMQEVRTRLISGDFRSYDSTTTLSEHGASTRLVYHGVYVPKRWVPALIGTSMMEAETRRQYDQLVAEVLRRHTPGSEMRPLPASASSR
jgi:hypothetical protein